VVFDQLLARGQIVIHPTDIQRTATLAQLAAGGEMVIADTRDHVGQINTVAAHHNHTHSSGNSSDEWSVVTDRGEQIRLGDKVATRRNDDHLLVANRQTWVVAGINPDGGLVLHRPGHHPRPDVQIPRDYVREYVELAYATTIHGAQGETASVAHAAVGDTTGHAAAYVAMSRGRNNNIAHLVADNPDQARTQWVGIFGRDRADLGPAAARRHVEENLERYGPMAARRPRPISPPEPSPAPQLRGIGI
jgi:hypothetical protein